MSASVRTHALLSSRTLHPRYKPHGTLNASNLSSLQPTNVFPNISQKASIRLPVRSPSPALVTAQAGRGFGKKTAAGSKAKPAGSSAGSSKLLEELGAAGAPGSAPVGKAGGAGAEAAEAAVCPCGGGGEGEKRAYKECCARYHGGVKEPDAVSLMKARYSAFAKGVIPYIVRTTHEDNPNMAPGGAEGRKKLTADCEETCKRLVFKRLEILSTEEGENDDESFVSFRAVYAYKHGTTTDNQILVEKSLFVRDPESGRWLYREKIPLDVASEAAWRLGPALVEQEQQQSGRKSYVMRGAAQPKLRPRSS
ncbi:unnamed protein product [Closterium sp. Yama58-4]|nr:unnamed protein product [Closterium sp. Yama58-4]